MGRYAVIVDGVVQNVVVWDGVSPWAPPDGSSLVDVTDVERCSPGDSYDGATFSAPLVAIDLVAQSAVQAVVSDQRSLLSLLDSRIALALGK